MTDQPATRGLLAGPPVDDPQVLHDRLRAHQLLPAHKDLLELLHWQRDVMEKAAADIRTIVERERTAANGFRLPDDPGNAHRADRSETAWRAAFPGLTKILDHVGHPLFEQLKHLERP